MNNFYKKFRGDSRLVRKRLTSYVPFFKGCHNVLDLGCGRGEFLGLMKESGIKALGIDSDPEEIQICRQAGYNVVQANIFDYLNSNKGFDGIMASHIIEHMDCKSAYEFVTRCFNVMEPGGVLAIVTPNPENLTAITKTFWLDPTHVRPYPLDYLIELLRGTGFEIIADGGAAKSLAGGVRATVSRYFWRPVLFFIGMSELRNHLYSAQDIYVVGRKP